MATGFVKWFNSRKGYGFITPDEGEGDIFAHYTAIVGEEEKFKSLYMGDKVKYNIVDGEKGPEAHEIEITEKAPRPKRQRRSEKPQNKEEE